VARQEILDIHCRTRSVALTPQDSALPAERSEGLSGAEIEQAVVSALYTAHAHDQIVSARHARKSLPPPDHGQW
jgi:ATP-dependent 26S proteasome regulatory subunit